MTLHILKQSNKAMATNPEQTRRERSGTVLWSVVKVWIDFQLFLQPLLLPDIQVKRLIVMVLHYIQSVESKHTSNSALFFFFPFHVEPGR